MAVFSWAAFTTQADLMPTALDGVTDGSLSAVSSELDNATNLDTHMVIEIALDSVTFGTSAYIEVYMIKAPDGTNYDDAPVAGGAEVNSLIATLPVKNGSGAKRVTSGLIVIPPMKVKFYVTNQTGVTWNNTTPTNTFDVYTGTIKSV